MNLRETILAQNDFKIETHAITGWGTVRLRELSAGQLVFLAGVDGQDQTQAGRIYSRLAAMSLVDEEGALLFDPDSDADVDLLQQKSWSSLERLGRVIMEFNGFGMAEAREKN